MAQDNKNPAVQNSILSKGSIRPARFIFLVVGLFLVGSGIVLTVKSALGISALSVVPYTVSQITGVDFSVIQFCFFTVLVALEIPILRRGFGLFNILQLVTGFLVSFFIFIAERLYAFVQPTAYWQQLLVLLLGIVVTAVGIYLTVEADLIVNAPEGLTRAIAQVKGWSFPNVKIGVDCALVVIAAIIGLVFARRIIGIREGTLLSALLMGKVIGLLPKAFKSWVHRLCYGDVQTKSAV